MKARRQGASYTRVRLRPTRTWRALRGQRGAEEEEEEEGGYRQEKSTVTGKTPVRFMQRLEQDTRT